MKIRTALSVINISICTLMAAAPSVKATVFFDDDFENGVTYLGAAHKHPNGGYVAWLGGQVSSIKPGDGTQDPSTYNNVILDSTADAVNSITGSKNALKTQYKGGKALGTPDADGGYSADYAINTTVISFPESPTVYVRWYQKWGKNWIWPDNQQKLLKILGPEQSQNFMIDWGHNYLTVQKKSPPPYDNQNNTVVFADLTPTFEAPSEWRQNDSDSTTGNFPLETNKWYCIEILVKSNTPNLSDGELAYWIDNTLRFDLRNTINRGASTRGMDGIQMQHVVQRGSLGILAYDTPTWMDNIVVADSRIGCAPASAPPTPPLTPVLIPK